MATFSSKPVVVPVGTQELFSKFDNLTLLQDLLDKLPQEARDKVGNVSFEKDSIRLQTTQVGEIKFVVKERVAPDKIVFGTESSPVPLTLTALLKPEGEDKTEITAQTEVQIPPMLKSMIGGPMQKATDQFAALIGQLAKVGK